MVFTYIRFIMIYIVLFIDNSITFLKHYLKLLNILTSLYSKQKASTVELVRTIWLIRKIFVKSFLFLVLFEGCFVVVVQRRNPSNNRTNLLLLNRIVTIIDMDQTFISLKYQMKKLECNSSLK